MFEDLNVYLLSRFIHRRPISFRLGAEIFFLVRIIATRPQTQAWAYFSLKLLAPVHIINRFPIEKTRWREDVGKIICLIRFGCGFGGSES